MPLALPSCDVSASATSKDNAHSALLCFELSGCGVEEKTGKPVQVSLDPTLFCLRCAIATLSSANSNTTMCCSCIFCKYFLKKNRVRLAQAQRLWTPCVACTCCDAHFVVDLPLSALLTPSCKQVLSLDTAVLLCQPGRHQRHAILKNNRSVCVASI